MSIGEDNSSDALGYVYSSSPPHIDTHSQPGSTGAVSLEAATQLDYMDFRFEMNNTCQQKVEDEAESKEIIYCNTILLLQEIHVWNRLRKLELILPSMEEARC